MIALGIWQLQRAEWKADLLSRYEAANDVQAVPFPTGEDYERFLFRRSSVICKRVIGMRAGSGRNALGQTGWAQVARCELDGGGSADVRLGWSRSPLDFTWTGGEISGWIAPAGEGAALIAEAPPAGLQKLAPPDPKDLPNNHLAYAGQWFFFALTALVIYWLALRSRKRRSLT